MSKCVKVIRRSQNDIIKTAVGSYLRRRNYIDTTERFKKSELTLSQSWEDMVLHSAIEKDISNLNSVMYQTVNKDVSQAEQQFSKLKSWTAGIKDENCRNELSCLLLPVFCHLYLDFVQSGHRLTHLNSIRESLRSNAQEQPLLTLADELHNVLTPQDIALITQVKTFRSGKYEFKISSKAFVALRKYLVDSSSILLLQVLQTWFELDVLADGSSLQEDDGTTSDISDIPLACGSSVEDEVKTLMEANCNEKKLKLLQDAIRIVRESPLVPNPIIIYTLHNLENLCCASVHRSMKLLATGDVTSELRLWNLSETKFAPRRTFCVPLGCDVQPLVHIQQDNRHTVLRGHCGPISDVSFLTEAEVLLSASYDCTMRAWKMGDYSCAAVYRGHNYPLWSLAVSPLGMHIATGSQDRTARIWNLDRTYPLRVLAGHNGDVNCLAFHPNNCYIASGSVDKSVRLWSVSSGSLARVFVGHTGSIQTLAFSPNGKYIASAGDGGRVKIWDLAGGGVLANLKGNSSRAVELDWSKCGSLVASASDDGKVQMWDVEKAIKAVDDCSAAEPLCQYNTGCGSLLSLQFSLRNTCILVASNS